MSQRSITRNSKLENADQAVNGPILDSESLCVLKSDSKILYQIQQGREGLKQAMNKESQTPDQLSTKERSMLPKLTELYAHSKDSSTKFNNELYSDVSSSLNYSKLREYFKATKENSSSQSIVRKDEASRKSMESQLKFEYNNPQAQNSKDQFSVGINSNIQLNSQVNEANSISNSNGENEASESQVFHKAFFEESNSSNKSNKVNQVNNLLDELNKFQRPIIQAYTEEKKPENEEPLPTITKGSSIYKGCEFLKDIQNRSKISERHLSMSKASDAQSVFAYQGAEPDSLNQGDIEFLSRYLDVSAIPQVHDSPASEVRERVDLPKEQILKLLRDHFGSKADFVMKMLNLIEEEKEKSQHLTPKHIVQGFKKQGVTTSDPKRKIEYRIQQIEGLQYEPGLSSQKLKQNLIKEYKQETLTEKALNLQNKAKENTEKSSINELEGSSSYLKKRDEKTREKTSYALQKENPNHPAEELKYHGNALNLALQSTQISAKLSPKEDVKNFVESFSNKNYGKNKFLETERKDTALNLRMKNHLSEVPTKHLPKELELRSTESGKVTWRQNYTANTNSSSQPFRETWSLRSESPEHFHYLKRGDDRYLSSGRLRDSVSRFQAEKSHLPQQKQSLESRDLNPSLSSNYPGYNHHKPTPLQDCSISNSISKETESLKKLSEQNPTQEKYVVKLQKSFSKPQSEKNLPQNTASPKQISLESSGEYDSKENQNILLSPRRSDDMQSTHYTTSTRSTYKESRNSQPLYFKRPSIAENQHEILITHQQQQGSVVKDQCLRSTNSMKLGPNSDAQHTHKIYQKKRGISEPIAIIMPDPSFFDEAVLQEGVSAKIIPITKTKLNVVNFSSDSFSQPTFGNQATLPNTKEKSKMATDIFCMDCEEFVSIEEADRHSLECANKISDHSYQIERYIRSTLDAEEVINRTYLAKIEHLNQKIRRIIVKMNNLIRASEQDNFGSNFGDSYKRLVKVAREIVSEDSNADLIKMKMREFDQIFGPISSKAHGSEEKGDLLKSRCHKHERGSLPKNGAELEPKQYQSEVLQKIQQNSARRAGNFRVEELKLNTVVLSTISSVIESSVDYSENTARTKESEAIFFPGSQQNGVFTNSDDLRRHFYAEALNYKLKLPRTHPGRNLLIAELYDQCIEQKIPIESYVEFIKQRYEMF